MTDFYRKQDHPSRLEKDAMWNQIEEHIFSEKKRPRATVIQWRSFLLGNVAAILIIFAAIGVYSIVINFHHMELTPQTKIDTAYESALKQLTSVTPVIIKQANDVEKPVLESKVRNIEDLDKMIQEIRTDMLINGSSQVKQNQLRRLYAMKLEYVKELLLAGKVNL